MDKKQTKKFTLCKGIVAEKSNMYLPWRHPELVSGPIQYISATIKLMKKDFFVYIMTNYQETTFYIGVTSDLMRRVLEHKKKEKEGFSKKYSLNKLVYFETTESSMAALEREKQLKRWHREWKINLIKRFNPNMDDLSAQWIDPETSSG